MSNQKTKKRRHSFLGFSFLFLIGAALAVAWFFLPIDRYVAQQSAERKGYTVVSQPKELDYKYYYNHLESDEEREAYNLICNQLPDFPNRIAIPTLSSEQIQNIYEAVSYDNPEFFFLGNTCRYIRFGALFYFEPTYTMTREQYVAQWNTVEEQANAFLSGISSSASDYEKELYVHDGLALIADYKTSSAEKSSVYTPYGLLVENKANCEGYSRGMQYLLKKLGVVSRVVSGTGTSSDGTENHMWNVVTISGKEYNVDATWDDYVVEPLTGETSTEPSHIYFNVSKTDMAIDHTPDQESLWENCVYNDLNYYEYNGLQCDSFEAASRALTRNLPTLLNEGKRTIELKFTSGDAYEDAVYQLIERDRIYYMLSSANVLVRSENRVSTTRLQYSGDSNHNVIRFFFRER